MMNVSFARVAALVAVCVVMVAWLDTPPSHHQTIQHSNLAE